MRKEREYKCVLVEKSVDMLVFVSAIALHIKANGIKKRGKTSIIQNNNVRHK